MTSPRIVVFGYSDMGHACLSHLIAAKENIAAVYTHEDHKGEKIWFPSVFELARKNGIPVFTEENFLDKQGSSRFHSLKPDLVFSFYYRNLIPTNILKEPTLGAFNMHGSFLPKYRGRAPVNWAVLNGETETGATLHVMTEKADAGDIVDQEKVTIGPDETAAMVQKKVTAAGVIVLKRQLDNLKAGRAPRLPQNAAQATYFGRRRPEDGEIDWNWPAVRIHNLIRAVTHPYPGAYGVVNGKKQFIWKSRLVRKDEAASSDRLQIICGDGQRLEILEIGDKS